MIVNQTIHIIMVCLTQANKVFLFSWSVTGWWLKVVSPVSFWFQAKITERWLTRLDATFPTVQSACRSVDLWVDRVLPLPGWSSVGNHATLQVIFALQEVSTLHSTCSLNESSPESFILCITLFLLLFTLYLNYLTMQSILRYGENESFNKNKTIL